MNHYHATPYDISATGFYFSTFEDYQSRAATHTNAYGEPVEEYDIQYIDGDQATLFNALSICQATLEQWFSDFEDLDGDDRIKAIYLARDLGYTVHDILPLIPDVCLFEGSARDYAEDYLQDSGLLDQMPEHLRHYIDTEAFARDLILSGDIAESRIEDTSYIVWGV